MDYDSTGDELHIDDDEYDSDTHAGVEHRKPLKKGESRAKFAEFLKAVKIENATLEERQTLCTKLKRHKPRNVKHINKPSDDRIGQLCRVAMGYKIDNVLNECIENVTRVSTNFLTDIDKILISKKRKEERIGPVKIVYDKDSRYEEYKHRNALINEKSPFSLDNLKALLPEVPKLPEPEKEKSVNIALVKENSVNKVHENEQTVNKAPENEIPMNKAPEKESPMNKAPETENSVDVVLEKAKSDALKFDITKAGPVDDDTPVVPFKKECPESEVASQKLQSAPAPVCTPMTASDLLLQQTAAAICNLSMADDSFEPTEFIDKLKEKCLQLRMKVEVCENNGAIATPTSLSTQDFMTHPARAGNMFGFGAGFPLQGLRNPLNGHNMFLNNGNFLFAQNPFVAMGMNGGNNFLQNGQAAFGLSPSQQAMMQTQFTFNQQAFIAAQQQMMSQMALNNAVQQNFGDHIPR